MQRLWRKISRAKKQGFVRTARILVDQIALRLLRWVYDFNRWHVEAPLSLRPYRRTVADMVNALQPKCVVEVGCGLGVVLSLVKAPSRHGYDLDAGAIRAARRLRGRDIRFTVGGMNTVIEDAIDVLILVNWIHDFSPERLAGWLQPLIPRTRYLLLDAIDADNPLDYLYKHDFAFLANQARLVSSLRPPGEGRHFLLYEVSP